jgi:plastocyanin
VAHTVTADPELAQDPSRVRLPEGASPFHSGIVAPGSNYTRTFTVRGTYVYICVPHEGQGMVGRVVVE